MVDKRGADPMLCRAAKRVLAREVSAFSFLPWWLRVDKTARTSATNVTQRPMPRGLVTRDGLQWWSQSKVIPR
jgi:hypothetical protein